MSKNNNSGGVGTLIGITILIGVLGIIAGGVGHMAMSIIGN